MEVVSIIGNLSDLFILVSHIRLTLVVHFETRNPIVLRRVFLRGGRGGGTVNMFLGAGDYS